MADETPGRVAATLAAIRTSTRFGTIAYADNHSCPDVANSCSAHHALRLLAAVEAALANHEEFDGTCSGCTDAYGDPAAWPCVEYRAITAALTGTQPSEDESHG